MLKGKSVIELTNVKTGQVERYEDENLVTNAVQDYLNAIVGMYGMGTSSERYMPMYNNALGGIKLFENSIDEDASKYMIPSVGQNKVIGYASATTKANADARRGNLNLQETTTVDNGMQLVWDFTTSEANGTISCVCLTSKKGGEGSYEFTPLVQGSAGANQLMYENYGSILGYDRTNNFIYIYKNSKVLKCKFEPDIIRLDKKFFEPEIIEVIGEYTIGNSEKMRMLDENSLYLHYMYKSGSYGKLYEYIYDIHTGGKNTTNEYDIAQLDVYTSGVPYIANGYIFLPHTDFKKMYKINRANKSDVSLIEVEGAELSYNVRSLPNGDVACGNLVIDPVSGAGDIIFNRPSSSYTAPAADYKGFVIMGRITSESLCWGTNELALMTINNLQTPVTKTADKTMKITYTLLYSE